MFRLDLMCTHRMILANTEELHDKIEELLDRIRSLEDALRTLQASVSTQPHPLLAHLPVDAPSPSVAPPAPQTEQDIHYSRETDTSQLSEAPLTPDADEGSPLDALGELIPASFGLLY